MQIKYTEKTKTKQEEKKSNMTNLEGLDIPFNVIEE